MFLSKNIHKTFGENHVLQGISAEFAEGKCNLIIGGSGSGKTTLLKLLAGVLLPGYGDIRYQGVPIQDDLAAYQHQICYVGHKSGVSLHLTVGENCQFELKRTVDVTRVSELLQLFSLHKLQNTPCSLLSMGQLRRVGLLRLLLSDASLWLLDEPLIALDQQAVTLLMSILTDHLAQGGQVVLTSHQTLPQLAGDVQEYYL